MTYIGNGTTTTVDSKFDQAASFNGAASGPVITISDANEFSPANNDLSFSAWIKTTNGYSSGGYISTKQDNSGGVYEWQLYLQGNGTVQLYAYTSAGSAVGNVVSTATVNDGNWHNIAFVIDTNTSLSVYVDKVGITSTSWSNTMSNTATDISLGGAAGSTERVRCYLDQVRFFNTALSQSQIDDLYDNETPNTTTQIFLLEQVVLQLIHLTEML